VTWMGSDTTDSEDSSSGSEAIFRDLRAFHERSLFKADTYARAEDVMMSVSEPDPENLRFLNTPDCECIDGESFGPPSFGEIDTLVTAIA
jgi:hypothetical protein